MSKTYTCAICDTTTHHPEDVRQGYCPECHAFTRTPAMTTWTIFDHPLDQPNHVVVRGFDIFNGRIEPVPRNEGYLFHTVNDARLWLAEKAPGAARFARGEGDHPNIVESWI